MQSSFAGAIAEVKFLIIVLGAIERRVWGGPVLRQSFLRLDEQCESRGAY